MGIEVRQLIVKSNVMEDGAPENDSQSDQQLTIKRAILEECREMIERALKELKER